MQFIDRHKAITAKPVQNGQRAPALPNDQKRFWASFRSGKPGLTNTPWLRHRAKKGCAA
jgi:hypothetical protein